jgi:hypothetical protein
MPSRHCRLTAVAAAVKIDPGDRSSTDQEEATAAVHLRSVPWTKMARCGRWRKNKERRHRLSKRRNSILPLLEKRAFVPGIKPVQSIRYKCGRAFVPGIPPGTNVNIWTGWPSPPVQMDFPFRRQSAPFCSPFLFFLFFSFSSSITQIYTNSQSFIQLEFIKNSYNKIHKASHNHTQSHIILQHIRIEFIQKLKFIQKNSYNQEQKFIQEQRSNCKTGLPRRAWPGGPVAASRARVTPWNFQISGC